MANLEILGLFVLYCLAAYLIFDLSLTRWGKEMRRDFEREFPGHCALGAFIQYGISHGYEPLDAKPKPHKCIEGMSRWAPEATKEEKP